MLSDPLFSPFSAPKKKARIEIIPLIDVIFFLLATFVLFTLSLNKIQSLELALPVGNKESEGENVVIQVSDGGSAYWNTELISQSDVPARLAHYLTQTKLPRVLVSSDERAKYGDTIVILDYVRKAGIQQVSVETLYRATGK